MNIKARAGIILILLIFAGITCLLAQDSNQKTETPVEKEKAEAPSDSTAAGKDSTESEAPENVIIVYYFHGTRRCVSCRKIEAYSAESIEKGFVDELEDGRLEWHVINIDEPENKHFMKDYELYTKSLVVVDTEKGKQLQWKNLKNVWQLLNSKDAFMKYVQREVQTYLDGE